MLESVLTTMGWAVSNLLMHQVEPTRVGNENMTSAPSGTFQTRDGLINIAANQDRQWEQLVAVLHAPALKEDIRYQPSARTVAPYFDHPEYIDALAKSVERAYAAAEKRPDVLVCSYHGVPRRYLLEGDPYHLLFLFFPRKEE